MLVSAAINQAFRDANLTTVGQVPTADEVTEAVQLLNNFWTALLGNEVGENYTDWYVPPPSNVLNAPANLIGPLTDDALLGNTQIGSWYLNPIQNSRVLMTLTTSGTTIYMPQFPDPGARIHFTDIASSAVTMNVSGNGHLIAGSVALTATTPQLLSGKGYLFRDDTASWTQIVPITSADASFPLPSSFDDMWIAYLALRIQPRNSGTADEVLVEVLREMKIKLKQRYRNFQATAVADPRVTQGFQSFHNIGVW